MKRNEHDAFREMEIYLAQKKVEQDDDEGFGGLGILVFIVAVSCLLAIFAVKMEWF
jgi:hypothetical protein